MNTDTHNTNEVDGGRTHYIQNVNYSLLVSGGTRIRNRRTAMGYRINSIDENGTVVTVADAVCRDTKDHYKRKTARDIIDGRLDDEDEDVRRRYTFRIPRIASLPTNSEEWRNLDRAVIKAVQYHNNAQRNENNAVFLSGSSVNLNVSA